MDSHTIKATADELLKLMLEKQPGLFAPGGVLTDPVAARKAAEAVMAFREAVMDKLREAKD